MSTWILLGVTAIVLVAVIIRLMFGRPHKRRAPLVFDERTVPPAEPSDDQETVEQSATLIQANDSDVDAGQGELERTSIHSTAASVSDQFLNGEDTSDSVPVAADRLSRRLEIDALTGENRIAAPRHSIFSDFRGIVHSSGEPIPPPEPEDLPIDDTQLTFGSATTALAQMLPESERRKGKQRQDLAAAGYHSRGSWLNLNSVRFVLAFLALASVGFALLVAPPVAEPYLLAALVAAPLVAWALPPLIVSSRAGERRSDVERGIPDALDMLNMGVSQGLTVQSSLRRIGPEIAPVHPALADELRIVNRQAQMGSLSQALHNFAKRMDSTEVSSFTSLLIQSEATGTSVSRALTDYSDSMRSTFRERADSRANAASFKLLFPTVLCLMPSVFLFLLGPAVVSMSDFFEGTANELLEGRDNAINTLDQSPRVVPEDR